MDKHFLSRSMTLLAVLGLAVMGLLLTLLTLGRSMAGAMPGTDRAISDLDSPSATFTVSGIVTCQATGPISNVEVFVWIRDRGTGWVGDVTDANGVYSVPLPQGDYDFVFNPRCGSACASQARKGITGPADMSLNVTLPSGYSISGTVFATNGVSPVGNVAIYAFNRDTADGFGSPPTDANGHFCINLEPGTYDLGFAPPPCLGLGPKTEFITLTQAMTLDIILPPGFTTGGRVTNPSGSPVPGVQVYANDPTVGGFGFAPTNESGDYSGTLPAGTYDIQFIPPAGLGLGSVTITDVTSATAGCPNTSLPITLPTGFTLSGKVTCKGTGIKNTFAYAEPIDPHDPQNSVPGWGLYSVDDGSYRLPLVPGTYSLEFTPPPAAGLDTKAFTTTPIITDTILNVEMCLCDGGWGSETVDSDGNVGQYTSLALEPTWPYIPHISYHNVTSYSLKYARLSGNTWLSETIDPQGGQWTCLALAPTYPYTPCISYHDYEGWSLKYAGRISTTSWAIMSVRNMRVGVNGTALALEPTHPFTPHISAQNPWDTLLNLEHAYLSGTEWMRGTWVTETVEPPLSETGASSSLALEPTYPYTPHISYYDRKTGHLKHAWRSGTAWLTETVDSEGDVGLYTSLALDSSGKPHISYLDNTHGSLKYAWLSGTTWLSQTLVSTGWSGGMATSLKLDRADTPYISYYDAINGDLKLAYLKGGVWIIHTVDSNGDVGQYSSLALNQAGCPTISYYDATNGDLKYAYTQPASSLAGHKQGSPNPVQAGAQLTYTIHITNTGSSMLSGVVTDVLPAHVTPTGSLTWPLTNLASKDVWTQTVLVTVEIGYAGPLTNVVQVATLEGARDTYTATSQAQVTALRVTKQASSAAVRDGEQLTYTICITNTGSVTLTGLVTDTLPANVTPGGIQTWMLDDLAPGNVWTRPVVVTVTLGYSGILTNSVQVITREGVTGTNQAIVHVLGYQTYLPLVLKD
jgi:uncharacterized repeat protein (TIGR01451 family)